MDSSDEQPTDMAAKPRPRSELWDSVSDGPAARRPSVPSIRSTFPSPAPLNIRKPTRPNIQTAITAGFVTHITPPETPLSETSGYEVSPAHLSLFHNYLRAMHAFDPFSTPMPEDDASQSAVALRPGDVILVHCVHANGWADGTVLSSGERGWLPTNYCEAYDHPYLRNLLNAMTQFWDLLGDNENANLSTFVRQDYIRGLIAGVRFLLERTDCLHREAASVKQHAGIRRMRKGLLADLSSLVQIAKRLQDMISEPFACEVIHVLVDDLVSKACKVVTRAVGFTDVWTQETAASQDGVSLPVILQSPRLSVAPLAIDTKNTAGNAPSSAIDSAVHLADFPEKGPEKDATTGGELNGAGQKPEHVDEFKDRPLRQSMIFTPPDGHVAHRVSLIAKESGRAGSSGPLASEQLATVHDICISHIGTFIGHHLHSRPCSELVATTERLVKACRSMLAIVEEVFAHDPLGSPSVKQAKDDLAVKVDELGNSTKDVFRFSDSADDEAIMLPDQADKLINVATSLIRNTGECVVRTRQLIEQLGDFDLKTSAMTSSSASKDHEERPLSPEVKETAEESSSSPKDDVVVSPKRISLSHRLSKSMGPPPPPLARVDLPPLDTSTVALASTSDTAESATLTTPTTAASVQSLPTPAMAGRRSLLRNSQFSSHLAESLRSPLSARSDSRSPARKDSVGVSIAGSTDTFYSSARDSGTTAVSQVSTRATTPEHGKDASSVSDPSLVNSFASISSMPSIVTDDGMDAESQLLQKTYANELTFNKDGQVTGGSLPALVEQLTTHDTAPDPQFVTAFFLTFRKFCEPREFAQALIDRFDYIGDNRQVGTPARLRIYNIFKGWLETYWSADADKDALGEIRFFALHKLKQILPTAGDRLIELTRRITEAYSHGTISGPLVSGVGKTSMSIGGQHGKGKDTPDSMVTSKQLNALRVATGGGSSCNILDLEPTELARQITLLVMKLYCEIRPEELLSMEWTKSNTKKAKNVRKMCLLNTDLAHMIADSILGPEDAKKRANVIKHWVKVCMACLELSNYDTIMAIMCTINNSVVRRLKRTWDLVNKKTKARIDELNEVVDMSKNFATLRRRLDTPTAPCLPFLGVYLTDLTFVIAGNPKRRELPGSASETGEVVSVINFDMYMRIAKIISHLQKFQVAYKLKPVPEMQTWIEQHLQRMRQGHDDMLSTLHHRSLAVEPKQEDRKHSIVPSAFRSDSEERPKTAASNRNEPTTVDRFDFFPFKGSALSMRSTTTLATMPESDRESLHPKRSSAQ